MVNITYIIVQRLQFICLLESFILLFCSVPKNLKLKNISFSRNRFKIEFIKNICQITGKPLTLLNI